MNQRVMKLWARGGAVVMMLLWLVSAGPALAESTRTGTPYRVSKHFKFYGDKDTQPTLDKIAALAESHFAQLCGSLGACELEVGPIDLWIAAHPEKLAAELRGFSQMTECAAGVAFLDEHRVILRAQPGASMTVMEAFDHMLAHVLAHAHELADARPVPRWFREGLAIRLSGDGLNTRLADALRKAPRNTPKSHLTYDELTGQFPERGPLVEHAYAQSALLIKRAVEAGGVDTLVGILEDTGHGVPFEQAFDKRLSTSPAELFAELERDLEGPKSSPGSSTPWAVVTLVSIVVAWWSLRNRKRKSLATPEPTPTTPAAPGEFDEDLPPELRDDDEPTRQS